MRTSTGHGVHTMVKDHDFRFQYETLRALQAGNGAALQLLADLEADLNHLDYSEPAILRPVQRLGDEVLLMAQELNLMTSDRHHALYDAIKEIRANIRSAFRARPKTSTRSWALLLSDDTCTDPQIAGGKAAGLASLRSVFPNLVPDGFVITTDAYRAFLEHNRLAEPIKELLTDLEVFTGHPRFQERTRRIRDLVRNAPVPPDVARAIQEQATALASRQGQDPTDLRWAVRSSATSEDATLTFAGQFDTRLNVPGAGLEAAYREVLASRFSDRAVMYRLHFGFREIDTPMAVLFVPMVDAEAAGVVYSRDPLGGDSDRVLVSATAGLADRLVRGEEEGVTVVVPLDGTGRVREEALRVRPAARAGESERGGDVQEEALGEDGGSSSLPGWLSRDLVSRVANLAREAAEKLGHEVDMEWACDPDGHLWLLQCRPLRTTQRSPDERRTRHTPPLLENGYTLFPGRAEGPVEVFDPDAADPVLKHKAPVLVTDDATMGLARVLPRIAALLVRRGSPVGHVAALVREYRVPTIYGLGEGVKLLEPGQQVSVDATLRRIHRGSRWPGVRERVLARVGGAREKASTGPLHDLVLSLNLTDAHSSAFKARNCRSLHDVVRFIHEMSIRSMFRFGDRHNRFWRRSVKTLVWDVPVKLKLLDLDGCTPVQERKLTPDQVGSVPFRALVKGMQDPRVRWDRRVIRDLENLPSHFVEQVLGGTLGPRRPGDANYVVVASDYLNLNARFVFHYGMLDAIVGPAKEANHVHFRVRGGGADETRMTRRARFLEEVLRSYHFGVDRRGSLVTAWLRNYPETDCTDALEMLGRLMACSRQLDMILTTEAMVERLVRAFIAGDYAAFA